MPSKESVEKFIALLEILLHTGSSAFCLGASVASALALMALCDIICSDGIGNDVGGTEILDHKRIHKFEDVAWFIMYVCPAMGVLQIIMVITRAFCLENFADFINFAKISILLSIVLGFAMILGGVASMANAVNVKEEYLDKWHCSFVNNCPNPDGDPNIEILKRLCHSLEKLRNCQAAAAALAFLGGGTFVLLISVTVRNLVIRRG